MFLDFFSGSDPDTGHLGWGRTGNSGEALHFSYAMWTVDSLQKTKEKEKEKGKGKGKRRRSGWRWKWRRPVVSWESCRELCYVSSLLFRIVVSAAYKVEGEREREGEGEEEEQWLAVETAQAGGEPRELPWTVLCF